MERREFLKKSLSLGLGAGALFLPRGLMAGALAEGADLNGPLPDLVALKGPSPEAMFDRGIEALGGMKRFVKSGQTVLIKPNISWDVTADGAANTPPALVARIIRHCLEAGARRVSVMDHSIEYWERTLRVSGIGEAIREAGREAGRENSVVYAESHDVRFYRQVNLNGTVLKTVQVHETLLDNDVFINVPVLKHHGGTGVSIAIKNLMGCVWNRREYHSKGLHACIADFLHVRTPNLNVVDAYRVITRHGPRGGSSSDVAAMNAQIISPDIVAADAAAARMLEREPSDVGHIRLAAEAGFGKIDLAQLNIERIEIDMA
ncbi:MAG: DUF362 domain-containing protein [Synergistaceae bacterium]|nr:DUF362 domain-containing protein [Synergistaceae bacterium]